MGVVLLVRHEKMATSYGPDSITTTTRLGNRAGGVSISVIPWNINEIISVRRKLPFSASPIVHYYMSWVDW